MFAVRGVVLGCCCHLWGGARPLLSFVGWCWAIVHCCCCCVVVCWWVTLGGLGWEYSPFVALKMANDEWQFHHCLSFGCHVAVSDVAPGSHVKVRKEDVDGLTHCGQ